MSKHDDDVRQLRPSIGTGGGVKKPPLSPPTAPRKRGKSGAVQTAKPPTGEVGKTAKLTGLQSSRSLIPAAAPRATAKPPPLRRPTTDIPLLDADVVADEIVEDQTAQTALITEENNIPDFATPDNRMTVDPRDPAEVELTMYVREARHCEATEPERAALLYLEAANVAERAERSFETLYGHLDAALKLAPKNSWLLGRVRQIFQRHKQFQRAGALAEKQAELSDDASTKAAIWVEVAALRQYQHNDLSRALEALDRAIAADPGHFSALWSAVAIHQFFRQAELCAERTEKVADLIKSPTERSALLFSAGLLREGKLNQLDRAEKNYIKALDGDPHCAVALWSLAGIYDQQARPDLLCRTLESLARLAKEPHFVAQLMLRTGSLHMDVTGDLTAAATNLQIAVEADANNYGSVQRLAYVYETKGRHLELVGALRHLHRLTLDAQGQAALLVRMAQLYQYQLSDVDQAIDAYTEALRAYPGYVPALQALGSLYQSRGNYQELIAILGPEMEGALNNDVRAARAMEVADIYAQRLGNLSAAIAHYHRAVELLPTMRTGLWVLYDLLHQDKRAVELNEVVGELSQLSTDPATTAALLIEQSQLQAGPLGQAAQAIATLSHVSAQQVTWLSTFALLRLYARQGQHADRVALWEQIGSSTIDAQDALVFRLRAANACEFQLEQPERALDLYRLILSEHPTCVQAIRAAGRIYARLGRWSDLADLYRHELSLKPAPSDAALLHYRIGRILQQHMGQTKQALHCYGEALACDPALVPALAALEHVARMQGQWEQLIDVLGQFAQRRTEPSAAADAWVRAGEVAESQLKQPEQALQFYQRALERCPDLLPAHVGALRIYYRKGQWQDAAKQLEHVKQLSLDTEQRAFFTLELCRLQEYRLDGSTDLAGLEAAAAAPLLGRGLDLERCRVRREYAQGEFLPWLTGQAQQTDDDQLATAYWVEAAYRAELSPQLIEHDAGRNYARAAYERNPTDTIVQWQYERQMWKLGEWDKLARLSASYADQVEDIIQRANHLNDAAWLYARAGRWQEAQIAANACIGLCDTHVAAWRLLSLRAEQQQQWSTLATCYERLSQSCKELDNRANFAMKAAHVWHAQLNNHAEALRCLYGLLDEQPTDMAAFELAADLLRANRDYPRLAALYRARVEVTSEKPDLLRTLAQIQRDKLDDGPAAITTLTELVALQPDDVTAWQDLATLQCVHARYGDAVQSLNSLVEASGDDLICRKQAQRLLASVLWQQLHDAAGAEKILTQVISQSPEDVLSKQLMVEIYIHQGQWQDARQLLEQMAAEPNVQLQLWAMRKLVDVAKIGLRDPELSRNAELEAVGLATEDPQALAILMQHYRQQEEPLRLIELAEAALKNKRQEWQRLTLHLLIGSIWLHDAKDPIRAQEQSLLALKIDANHADAGLLLGQSLEQQSDYAAALERYRTIKGDDRAVTEALHGMFRVLSKQGLSTDAALTASVLEAIKAHLSEEAMQARTIDGLRFPRGVIDWATFKLSADMQAIELILQQLKPYAGQIFSHPLPGPAQTQSSVLTQAVMQLANCLSMDGEISIQVTSAQQAALRVRSDLPPASSELGDKPSILLSPTLVSATADPLFRFWTGRALAQSATTGVLLQTLSDAELDALVRAACSDRVDSTQVQQLRKQVGKVLPRRVRKQLEITPIPPLNASLWRSFREAELRRADQIALLLCGVPKVALECLAQVYNIAQPFRPSSGPLAPIIRYILSGPGFVAWKRLWG